MHSAWLCFTIYLQGQVKVYKSSPCNVPLYQASFCRCAHKGACICIQSTTLRKPQRQRLFVTVSDSQVIAPSALDDSTLWSLLLKVNILPIWERLDQAAATARALYSRTPRRSVPAILANLMGPQLFPTGIGNASSSAHSCSIVTWLALGGGSGRGASPARIWRGVLVLPALLPIGQPTCGRLFDGLLNAIDVWVLIGVLVLPAPPLPAIEIGPPPDPHPIVGRQGRLLGDRSNSQRLCDY